MLALVLAAVLGCADLCSADAVTHYAALLEQGGYGRLPFERAGFLIRESDGTITLEPWRSFGFQRASSRLAIPVGAIAIAHTHPLASREPSAGDRETARQVGLPVIVITPDGVTAVVPDGSVQQLVRGGTWWR